MGVIEDRHVEQKHYRSGDRNIELLNCAVQGFGPSIKPPEWRPDLLSSPRRIAPSFRQESLAKGQSLKA